MVKDTLSSSGPHRNPGSPGLRRWSQPHRQRRNHHRACLRPRNPIGLPNPPQSRAWTTPSSFSFRRNPGQRPPRRRTNLHPPRHRHPSPTPKTNRLPVREMVAIPISSVPRGILSTGHRQPRNHPGRCHRQGTGRRRPPRTPGRCRHHPHHRLPTHPGTRGRLWTGNNVLRHRPHHLHPLRDRARRPLPRRLRLRPSHPQLRNRRQRTRTASRPSSGSPWRRLRLLQPGPEPGTGPPAVGGAAPRRYPWQTTCGASRRPAVGPGFRRPGPEAPRLPRPGVWRNPHPSSPEAANLWRPPRSSPGRRARPTEAPVRVRACEGGTW